MIAESVCLLLKKERPVYAFRSPAALEYIPWEDESREEFEERSKFFGLKWNTE